MTGALLVGTAGVGVVRDGRRILDDVAVAVHEGASVALVGPSGSGKSTLLALPAGLEPPDAGSVTRLLADDAVGLVLQAYGLVSLLTAAENVELALQTRSMRPHRVRRRAAAALAEVRLSEVADHLTESLSGGQQQRVAVARALVIGPRLVLADEVTAALDPATAGHVVDLLLAVAHAGGATVLATHDAAVAARCDRTIRLVDGRVAV